MGSLYLSLVGMQTPIPPAFWDLMREQFPEEDQTLLQEALEKRPSRIGVRYNSKKLARYPLPLKEESPLYQEIKETPIPWSSAGYLFPSSESYTFATDPFWQAGYYYVQEPSSMLIERVRGLLPSRPLRVLDLCAAPGGKSTLLMDILPQGSTILCNEPIAKRATILEENMRRWGYPWAIVTQAYPDAFLKTKLSFDLILVDAPCSGEGMFRKSEEARKAWSLENVASCSKRQKEILDVAWQLLAPEGILLYSTCTYNHFENEENASYLVAKPQASQLELPFDEHWGVVRGKEGLGVRCFPHRISGEGFYLVAIEKKAIQPKVSPVSNRAKKAQATDKRGQSTRPLTFYPQSLLAGIAVAEADCHDLVTIEHHEGEISILSPSLYEQYQALVATGVKVRFAGTPFLETKGKNFRFSPFLPFSMLYREASLPSIALSPTETIQYFAGEAIQRSDISNVSGTVAMKSMGIPIGLGNAASNRINNLFPKSFRLRKRFL